jgi:hypothetical protein
LTDLMEPLRDGTPSYDTGSWRDALAPETHFGAPDEVHVSWRQPVDVEGVADRVASVSFIAALAADDKSRLLDRVRATASALPAPLSLAYTADVFVLPRRG